MGTKIKNFAALLGLSLIPTLLIWIPFALRIETFWGIPLGKEGMATIVANYDGPLFLVIAKTFYNLETIALSYSFRFLFSCTLVSSLSITAFLPMNFAVISFR